MIFALYHSAGEPIGFFGDVLKTMGLRYQDVHLYDGDGLPRDTGDLQGLVLMGGCMSAEETDNYPFLFQEIQLIEKLLSEGKPIFGICLGAQLIAKALGARIYTMKYKEIGWGPVELTPEGKKDPVFRSSAKKLNVFHWHGDTFDLPEGAVHLARSKKCENQAFRWGELVYGLQFHIEATPGMIRRWVTSKEGAQQVEEAGDDPNGIFNQSPEAFEKLKPFARKIFSSYIKRAFKEAVSSK